MNNDFFANKKVLVMGLGRFGGGTDVVRFLCSAADKVIVTDLAGREQLAESIRQLEGLEVEYHLGSHEPADFQKADIIVANPAIPLNNEFLIIARQANHLVTSQIEIFFELCPATVIGITGSNGKSTTATLTAHLLRSQFGNRIWLSGNIGNEPLLTILDRIKPNDLVVLELSSFQIEQLAQSKLAPNIALLTNLTPNHLDRYGTFKRYCGAKEMIFQCQESDENHPAVSIFNAEDKIACEWFEKYSKDAGRRCIKFSPDDVPDKIRKKFPLPGRANLANLAAALALTRCFAVTDKQIMACLPKFKALPHRLQLVAKAKGVRWYNDSKATTPDSAIVATDAFDRPIIIAGGYDKHIPFDELGQKIAQNAKSAILIGQTAKKIAAAIEGHKGTRAQQHKTFAAKVEFADSLAQAVQMAAKLAVKGDVVLLSPACASYDMFENYEHRGQQFIDLVGKLPS